MRALAGQGPVAETGATGARFPQTRWSALDPQQDEGGSPDSRRTAYEALAEAYWKPIYAHLRLSWRFPPDQAEDVTQDFFLWLMQRPFLARARAGRGRFRNLVRATLDNFVRNRLRDQRRRGPQRGSPLIRLDLLGDAESLIAGAQDVPPEQVLDLQWRRAVLERAVERVRQTLEERGRTPVFEVFRRYELAETASVRPTQPEIAQALGLSLSDVDHYLRQARQLLLLHVKAVVAESVDGPAALSKELSFFFAVRTP